VTDCPAVAAGSGARTAWGFDTASWVRKTDPLTAEEPARWWGDCNETVTIGDGVQFLGCVLKVDD